MTWSSTPVYRLLDTDLFLDEGKQYAFRDLPAEQRPREKLIAHGPSALSVSELLAVVFGVGSRKEDVLAMARRVLKEYGEKAVVDETDPARVQKALGLPVSKACQIVATFELGRRFYERKRFGRPEFLRTAKQVYDYLDDMRALPKEHLRGLYLDSHYRLVHDEVISIGSISANMVHPREVFRPAVDVAAAAVILAHNHPSGVVTPSEADIAVTRQIVEAGKILGINVLDHVIVTQNGFASVPVTYA